MKRRKGRSGERAKEKIEHITLVTRAPRVWWLYRLDAEYRAVNLAPGAQEQGQ